MVHRQRLVEKVALPFAFLRTLANGFKCTSTSRRQLQVKGPLLPLLRCCGKAKLRGRAQTPWGKVTTPGLELTLQLCVRTAPFFHFSSTVMFLLMVQGHGTNSRKKKKRG